MPQIVIIGAGPMGLDLAHQLRKAGVKSSNMIIIDLRENEYNRPGHLNANVFSKLEKQLQDSFWSADFGHIKDFERILYERVKKLNIPFKKKKFVRFSDQKNRKRILSSNLVFSIQLKKIDPSLL